MKSEIDIEETFMVPGLIRPKNRNLSLAQLARSFKFIAVSDNGFGQVYVRYAAIVYHEYVNVGCLKVFHSLGLNCCWRTAKMPRKLCGPPRTDEVLITTGCLIIISRKFSSCQSGTNCPIMLSDNFKNVEK